MYECMYVVMENFVLYEDVYGTYRHTNRSCLQRAAGDFYVYVYIQIRALGRMMMNVTEFLFVRTEPDTPDSLC
jgi:hypothetical protein